LEGTVTYTDQSDPAHPEVLGTNDTNPTVANKAKSQIGAAVDSCKKTLGTIPNIFG